MPPQDVAIVLRVPAPQSFIIFERYTITCRIFGLPTKGDDTGKDASEKIVPDGCIIFYHCPESADEFNTRNIVC
jgi:hypothetical protein